MRGFIVLCLSTLAVAAPQGYNYNLVNPLQQQGAGFSGSQVGALQHGASISGNPAVSVQHGTAFNGNPAGTIQHGAGFTSGQQSFLPLQGGTSAGSVVAHNQVHQVQAQQPIVSKHFFIHSAPEDNDEEDYKEKHVTVGVPRKNYNVVFIKAPAKSSKRTTVKISPAVNEEKTVIYVLSKKHDASDVHAEVVEHPTPTSKPEVFFIKYKTNEEAAHAQQQIQAQYDALGGSSHLSDEGVAAVSSVIGAVGDGGAHTGGAISGGSGNTFHGGASAADGGQQGHGVVGGATQSNNAYLPPHFV